MKVKICGIMDVETAMKAVESGADALGFVFAPSRRRIHPNVARKITQQLPKQTRTVGVFVNEAPEKIREITEQCQLDFIQLHGEESTSEYQNFSQPIIKAFGVRSHEQLVAAAAYPSDYVLLDSPKGKFYGGNGISFNWNLIDTSIFKHKRIILAGGLHEGNILTAIETVKPYMVDVSSGVETNGKKDLQKIKRFIQLVKNSERRGEHDYYFTR